MKIVLKLSLLLSLASCSVLNVPNSGMLYIDSKGTDQINPERISDLKKGEACSKGILGVVRGDSSVTAAAQDADITTISHVDHRAKSILGVYTEYCSVVYGR